MSGFDAVADGYDDVAVSGLGLRFRERVHEALFAAAPSPGVALDLGCGTGIDAVALAERGHQVVAVDASPAMLDVARRRCDEHGLADSVRLEVVDLAEPTGLRDLVSPGSVELFVADFGALDSLGDLRPLAAVLDELASPNAVAVVVSMNRVAPTERVAAVLRRDRTLWHRRSVDGRPADGPEQVAVHYRSSADVARGLGPGWLVEASEGIGVVLPTFEQRRLVEGRPKLLSAIDRVDRLLGRHGTGVGDRLGLGDHRITTLRRRS